MNIPSRLHCGLLAVLAFVTLVTFTPVHATSLHKLSLAELVEHSDVIVVGTCEKVETVWLDRKVYTVATVRVSQSAKGEPGAGPVIRVYTLGGTVTSPLPVKMHVPGAETIAEGEEMVLFLQKYGDQRQFHRVVGMAQGKLPVRTDPNTQEKRVGFDLPIKGVQWVDKDGKPVAPDAPGAQEAMAAEGSLDGFLGRIHKIEAERKAPKKKDGQP